MKTQAVKSVPPVFLALALSTVALAQKPASFGHRTSGIPPITVVVMPPAPGGPGPISPLVYGANFASQAQATALNLPINRNGGNATTRYNWMQDSTSSASDWYFLSHLNNGGAPSASVDAWVRANNLAGVGTLSMITIPIIGYVANVGPSGYSWSFSVAKYGPQQATEPYHPDAGNGNHTNGTPVTGNDPTDANVAVPISYQQGWLNHLVSTFGTAQSGGVGFYLLDNEPGLWMQTHRDVFPNGETMSDLASKEIGAANLVKIIDPSAQVCGSEEWGWLGYLYSGADYQWLAAHNWTGTPPDKAAHGGLDCVAYLLQQFQQASNTAGRRLLDVLSLHYYPQGSYGDSDASEAATEWRARATRSLWDPNYTDESWINANIQLIPRMKNWVNGYYPGTRLGITEYEWGADSNMGAAIAQADALGIYGRDGVYLANRWVCPAAGTPTYNAFLMYRNYDGSHNAFGDWPLPVSFPDPNTVSVFGSLDSSTGETKVMLVHKRTSGTAPVNVAVTGSSGSHTVHVYQMTSAGITHLSDIVATSPIPVNLPPQSVTLLIYRN